MLNFVKEFEKKASKIEGVTGESLPPRYWHSFGNHCINKVMSGDYMKGIPQGRLTGLAGPSGAGKSFILGNLIREAQHDGAFALVIDSENALDDDFLRKIGVDVSSENYMYKSVVTIPQVTNLVSAFVRSYKKEYAEDLETAPRVIIGIDSLDMLLTETEQENYEKGVTKGDQGQRNKQLKAMLRGFVQDIKNTNITMVVTSQVYRNQDIKNGEGTWIVSDAVRYSLSQIVLVTKLKLKDDSGKVQSFSGIRMKCQGFKTRFTKPFQTVEIEVPYETGIDRFSGLLEVAASQGIVNKKGARYEIAGANGPSWYSRDFYEYAEDVLAQLSKSNADVHIGHNSDEADLEGNMNAIEIAAARRHKILQETE